MTTAIATAKDRRVRVAYRPHDQRHSIMGWSDMVVRESGLIDVLLDGLGWRMVSPGELREVV